MILRLALVFTLLSCLANAASKTEVTIKNETDREVKIGSFVTNYSIVPEDTDLSDSVINPGGKGVFHFSVVVTRDFPERADEIKRGIVPKDGINLSIDGIPTGITWFAEESGHGTFLPVYFPIASAFASQDFEVVRKKDKGATFTFVVRTKQETGHDF